MTVCLILAPCTHTHAPSVRRFVLFVDSGYQSQSPGTRLHDHQAMIVGWDSLTCASPYSHRLLGIQGTNALSIDRCSDCCTESEKVRASHNNHARSREAPHSRCLDLPTRPRSGMPLMQVSERTNERTSECASHSCPTSQLTRTLACLLARSLARSRASVGAECRVHHYQHHQHLRPNARLVDRSRTTKLRPDCRASGRYTEWRLHARCCRP